MNNYERPLKLTVVGNGTVGKTSILVTYTTKEFPHEYIPTVFDNYNTNITIDQFTYNVTLWDTAGQEEYSRLRAISYPNTDAFILCYAVCDVTSFNAAKNKWVQELRHHCPHTPIILVGTKSDTRKKPGCSSISTEDGEMLAKTIEAAAFLECSALLNDNLELVFQEAVRANVRRTRNKKNFLCQFL